MYTAIIPEDDLWHIGCTHKGNIGLLWRRKRRLISRNVTNAKGMHSSHMCHLKHWSQYPALGHFAQWGMDIVGPLPITAAQKKFLLVATDYFSKWVEAEAYANIKDKDVTKFIWKNITCRFGIPQAIIADNGPQFDSIAFRNFCSELKIQNLYFTPRYSQSNG